MSRQTIEPDGQSVRVVLFVIMGALTIALLPVLGLLFFCLAAIQQQRRQRRYARLREEARQRAIKKRDDDFYRYMRSIPL